MSMNIKNKEAYRLTKQLAKLTGESLTTAVTEAVRERLDRVRRKHGVDLAERLLVIGRDCAAQSHIAVSNMRTCSTVRAGCQSDS